MAKVLTLTMCRGLPACGKSTWAANEAAADRSVVVVTKDDLRASLHGGHWSKSNEHQILRVRDFIITDSLQTRRSVICADTNLAPFHKDRFIYLAKQQGAVFVEKDFTHVPLQVCLKRDAARANSVGPRVILDMWEKYVKPQPEPNIINPNLANAVWFDLDGTLALLGERDPYDDSGACENDALNEPVASMLFNCAAQGYEIVICSGRSGTDPNKAATLNWLEKHQIPFSELHMRPKDITKPDSLLKREFLDDIRARYNILFAFDDRPSVIRMLRAAGVFTFAVAQSDKEF